MTTDTTTLDTASETIDNQTFTDNNAPETNISELSIESLQAQLDKILAENITLNELVLRAKAEEANARRRASEEVVKARKYALEHFAEQLLPVKDSLELGLSNTTQSDIALREGVEATLRLLATAFEKNQIIAIDPALGSKFDPSFHNGVSMIASEHPAQTIANVMQKGYQISDRVLRPALVAVSNG